MSFKDVRDLSEQLKLLGFPHPLPLQTLANKNGSLACFCVVAEILQWLADLLEPGALLAGGVESEDLRVLLIRSATEFFVTKSGIMLNPRKLYSASVVTAAELQKITQLLIVPTQNETEREEEDSYRSLNQIDIGDKMDDLRRARELSSELTQRGATLFDLLSKEMVNKEVRLTQASRPLELATVERTLKNAIAAAQLKLQASRAQLENARIEMNAMNSKLQRKRAELERTKQRLEALQKIRPAHMQEFEECEKELQELFQQYFQRIHVRDALRAQLEARTKRATPAPSPVLQKPGAEISSISFMPEGLLVDDDEDDEEDGIDEPRLGAAEDLLQLQRERRERKENRVGSSSTTGPRPGTATSRIRPTTGRSRRGGALTSRSRVGAGGGGDKVDDDSSFGSSDSDLDMDGILGISGLGGGAAGGGGGGSVGGSIGGGINGISSAHVDMLSNMGSEMGGVGDDDFDLTSMDDISISKITGELPLRPKTANKQEHHSDEDF